MCLGSRPGLRAVGVLVLLASAAWGRAREYKVVLDRPATVGQRYTIHGTGRAKQTQTIRTPGAAPQTRSVEFAMELDATIKVLAVDAKSGQATKLECTVSKCLKDQKPIVDPGAVLIAENKKGETAFSRGGDELGAEISGMLSTVLSVSPSGAPSNDETFGTDRPQKVGGTWPINSVAAAADLAKGGLALRPDQIKGDGKLVAVKEADGKQALQVEATMNVADLSVGRQKVESGTIAATFGGLFPTDPAAFPIRSYQTMRMHIKMTANGPNGQPVPVESDVERSNDVRYGPAVK